MAAPTAVSRTTPAGRTLPTTFGPCRLTFGAVPGLAIREFSILPGELDGGERINSTTFWNTTFHTFVPQTLIDEKMWTVKGRFDPDLYKPTLGIKAIANIIQVISFVWPNGSVLSNFGWARVFTFPEFNAKNTTEPEIAIGVEIAHWDPVNHVHADWTYTDGYTGTAEG